MTIASNARTAENETLLRAMLEWIAAQPRSYVEVMDAWRTSCPRLPIWEDAVDLGLVMRVHRATLSAMVDVTPAGMDFLRSQP